MPNTYITDNDKVVGFKKEAETILDQLIHGSKEREVVLITGMGGLGKTTLARRVYDDLKSLGEYFDKYAWCTVSQEYDPKNLLNKIYKQVWGSETKIDNVVEMLRKRLMGLRYLIVLDDIWSLKAWEELSRCFPDCDRGSRIILTSRQEDVISDAKHICHLPFFTSDECWQLLQMKLFKGKRFLKELENIGREISKKCGGLPLVVGLVAGLLDERVEKSEWQEVLNILNSHMSIRGGIQSNDAIELSYKYLSNHLKPCFLYFAAFPEDKKINVSRLINLWISEGFIDIIGKESIEDKAEDYLNHLVNSNLIMVSERDYDGRILTCIVHDLVRDFCLTKVKDENFLCIINFENMLDTTSEFTPDRISFHMYSHCEIPIEFVPWDSSIRTILSFRNFQPHSQCNYKGRLVAKKFEHVTILDLFLISVDISILSEVNSLIHLRYLALNLCGRGYVSPWSLKNLEDLITLRLTNIYSLDLHLPKYFWNMRSLRHMSISHVCDSCSKESVTETIPYSGVLQTLTLSVPLYKRDEDLLRKNPNLKALSCKASEAPFPEIGFLHHLEYLCLGNNYLLSPPTHLLGDLKLNRFPASIKKIELENITLCLSAISIISQLSNLEALILRFCSIEGIVENVEEEIQFPKLKYLKINKNPTDILSIINAEERFPCLEQLILYCWKEFKLPCTLAYISTLKVIVVEECHPSVDRSAKKIEEYASEMGNEQLNVEIKPWMLLKDEPQELSFVDDEPGEVSVVDDEPGELSLRDEPQELSFMDEPHELSFMDKPHELSFMDKPRSWARRFCCLVEAIKNSHRASNLKLYNYQENYLINVIRRCPPYTVELILYKVLN